ncbi:HpcH/HpaI aldolase family protein [Planctomicrobium sp. SH661]|uniref:HpcH/HpaI aldolase family protein n=1 Tax=Planctomicrobium sp. SH661 TaxID=3448124 RepID=UPI003F5CA35B
MRPSRIKAKLAHQEPVLITALHFYDPSVYELASLLGFDGLWLDLEHHATSVETASQLIRAARVGQSDVVARPAKGEFMRMARLLEAGAHGIMYPRCESADEARELVRWGKFAPMGTRGFDGGNGDMPYCMEDMAAYVEQANKETFLIAQLEDNQAVRNADAIAAVNGIDVLFFGVGDFSVLNGIPGQFNHPSIWEAIEAVAAAARRHGKAWGTPSFNPAHAERLMSMGATFLSHTSDLILLKQGLERMQRDYSQLGFTFGPMISGSADQNGYASGVRN